MIQIICPPAGIRYAKCSDCEHYARHIKFCIKNEHFATGHAIACPNLILKKLLRTAIYSGTFVKIDTYKVHTDKILKSFK